MSPLQIIALVLAIGSVLLAATSFPRSTATGPVRSFAKTVNLAVTREVDRSVLRRVQARSLSFAAGLVLAALVLMGVGLTGIDPGDFTGIVVVLVLYGSVGLCVAVSASAGRPWVPDGTPRVARFGEARIQDYVPGFELWGSRLLAGAAVLLCAGASVAAAIGGLSATAIGWSGYAALVVLTVVAWELNARRLLRRSMPAGSTQQLAWNDAMRSSLLRDTLTLPLTAGLIGTVAGPFHVLTRLPLPGWIAAGAGGAMFLLALLAVVAVIPIVFLTKPGQHYQRRLWPQLVGAPAGPAEAAAR